MYRKLIFMFSLIAILALVMAACAPEEPVETPMETPPSPDDGIPETGEEELMQIGEQVYADRCAGCHLPDGLGEPPLDANPFVTGGDPNPVIDIVLHGNGGMPAFEGVLTDEEVAGVVTYIRNAWTNDASVVTIADVQAAR